MKRKLLTDVELRACWSRDRSDRYYVPEGTILTPSAMDFVRENGIELCSGPECGGGSMSRTPIPMHNGKPVFRDYATGQELTQKPEGMTHLRGNLLVPKTHPQIAFRGKLDTLMAQIMGVQVLADGEGETKVVSDLEELVLFCQSILAAEVKDEPLGPIHIMGMDSARIRHDSQQVKKVFGIDHPIPNYRMGKICVALNRLRAQIREVELSAARAFDCGQCACSRPDIIEGLNRMSSCVYIIQCRKLSGYYDREDRL